MDAVEQKKSGRTMIYKVFTKFDFSSSAAISLLLWPLYGNPIITRPWGGIGAGVATKQEAEGREILLAELCEDLSRSLEVRSGRSTPSILAN